MSNVTIVIPVYNEEKQLADCLRTIAAQTVRPREVIVVDNNSTDRTVQFARRFKFVRVLTAKRQGVVHARNRGFNAVRTGIIGRIDADTRLPRDWVANVETIFEDDEIDAASGAVSYYDVPCKKLVAFCDLKIRSRTARLMADDVFLQGANMAMRRTAWRNVRAILCDRPGMHEDFDIAIHLNREGYNVRFVESLKASISARCIDDSLSSFWQYVWLNPRTYSLHDSESGRHMLPVVLLMLALHIPLRALHRGYDTNTGTFSLRQAFTPAYDRVNPATFVD